MMSIFGIEGICMQIWGTLEPLGRVVVDPISSSPAEVPMESSLTRCIPEIAQGGALAAALRAAGLVLSSLQEILTWWVPKSTSTAKTLQVCRPLGPAQMEKSWAFYGTFERPDRAHWDLSLACPVVCCALRDVQITCFI